MYRNQSNSFAYHKPVGAVQVFCLPSQVVRSKYGFTLLEMILAVTLVGVLAAIAISMLNTGINTREVIVDRGGEKRTLRLTLDLMSGPLYSVLPPTGELAGEFSGSDSDDLDELTFYAAVDPGEDFGGDVMKIIYSIDKESYDEPVLIRETTRNLLASTTQDPDVEILCRGVETLNFSYYNGPEWLDEWESAQNNNTLPKAVKITITLVKDEDEDDDNDDDDAPTLSRIIPLMCSSDSSSQTTTGGASE